MMFNALPTATLIILTASSTLAVPIDSNTLTVRSPSPDPAPGLFGGIFSSIKGIVDIGKNIAQSKNGKRDLDSQLSLEERGVKPLEIVKDIAKIFIREDATELQERGVNPPDSGKSVTTGVEKIIARELEEGINELD